MCPGLQEGSVPWQPYLHGHRERETVFPKGTGDSITKRKRDRCCIPKVKSASSRVLRIWPHTASLRWASSLTTLPALQPVLPPYSVSCHVSSVPGPFMPQCTCTCYFFYQNHFPPRLHPPPPPKNPTTTNMENFYFCCSDITTSLQEACLDPSESGSGVHPTSFLRPGFASLILFIIPNCMAYFHSPP